MTTPTTPPAPDPSPAPGGATATAPRTWATALVTGASSGIGTELARLLAAEGTDLVLVARDRGRLEALATALTDRHPGTEVEVLAADLSDPAELSRVEARVADAARPVDMLANNAGFGTYGPLVEADIDRESREIAVNVTAVVRLTHAALGAMVPRGRGAIMNVSSVAGLQATPGNATYGATKAFVASFSEAVHGELVGTGVSCTVVLPGFTRTEFQARAGIEERRIPRFAWQSAADCAREALDATRAGRAWCVTGPVSTLTASLLTPVPRRLRRRIAARVAARV